MTPGSKDAPGNCFPPFRIWRYPQGAARSAFLSMTVRHREFGEVGTFHPAEYLSSAQEVSSTAGLAKAATGHHYRYVPVLWLRSRKLTPDAI